VRLRALPSTMALVAVVLTSCSSAGPDAAATLKKVFADRPTVADADNAFLDVLGLAAPDGVDPHELGLRRLAWAEKFRTDPETAGDDPGKSRVEMKASRSPALSPVVDACRAAVARACGAGLERVRNAPLSQIEPLLLARYEVLLTRGGWYEIGSAVPDAPMPSYEAAIEAQRLMLIRLINAAGAGDAEKVRTTLTRDLAFWRRMLASSDILISKMLALAGIRQHFMLGSHVLRALPADRIADAIPAQWHEEFSAAERSMRRPIAGELVLAEGFYNASEDIRVDFSDSDEELPDPVDRLVNRLAQSRNREPGLGEIADYYLAVADAFEAPLTQYEAAEARLASNSIAKNISQYALRVGSAEGMRRAALLTAQLRSQSVPMAEIADRLEKSPLRNPFNGQPFDWDAADQAIVYTGPEHRKYRRQAYLY
jgi:hypothetical protein